MAKARRNKIVYNTETAYKIGVFSSGNETDETYFSQTLYTTRSGRYFLCSEGGRYSRFANENDSFDPQPGSKIEPLTKDLAILFAKKYLGSSVAELVKTASDSLSNDKLIPVTITLRESTLQAIDEACQENKDKKRHGQNRSNLVDSILREKLLDGKVIY